MNAMPEIVILTLTERRKSDRARMARQLADKTALAGATVSVEAEGSGRYSPHSTHVTVALKGFVACVTFDGKSVQPNTFVVPWYAGRNTDAKPVRRFRPGRGRKCEPVSPPEMHHCRVWLR